MSLKTFAKQILRSLIYRFPPVMIAPVRLYLWMGVLKETSHLQGDVLEVGCYLGGTAAVSSKFLAAIKSDRAYTVIDTFEGFDSKHFRNEVSLGANKKLASEFSSNSVALTRWVLNRHGAQSVHILRGDIASLDEASLPTTVSACLMDVDLAEPIYLGLHRIYSRLELGGVILVDDCDESDDGYKAKVGYERFMADIGMEPRYEHGMGLVSK